MAPPEPSVAVPSGLDAAPWGYPTWNTPVSAVPSHGLGHGGPRAQIKRALSESDDCDDVFSEESASKDQCSVDADGDEADSCQLLSRKKRRGVIEKRRRDRINTSLTELRRLVPSAFEKQGSAKLEKAEILQMTVDHLKVLHAKGLDALAYDPQRFAMDYHNIGFRECAAEVARYLVTVEGLDIQDPLRLRLMSHLQCFAAQRELASKQAASATWSYGAVPGVPGMPPSPTSNYATGSPATPAPSLNAAGHTFPTPPSSGHSSGGGGSLQHLDSPPSSSAHHHYEQTPTSACDQTPTSSASRHAHSSSTATSSPLTPLSSSSMATAYPTASPGHPHPYYSSQYPYHQNAFNHSAAGSKPYRPWGAEVAY